MPLIGDTMAAKKITKRVVMARLRRTTVMMMMSSIVVVTPYPWKNSTAG